jgi:hypothetical protein
MKRIGVFFGQERSFPLALCKTINEMNIDGVVAEPMQVGGVSLETPKRYDLILDRISQDIPFYRAILKKFAVEGTVVVNNPFWWSADDKFFNNIVARAVGVAVPKTVILPSAVHPPDTTAESMSNLVYPLNWEEIFAHIGWPAYLKPYSGGGWKKVYKVGDPEEFFRAYHETGDTVMTLQEEIVFDEYYRCYAVGQKYIRIMPYEPRNDHFNRYIKEEKDMDPKMHERIHGDILKLVGALGYDFDTLEFAVRDGIPYAIDFLNCAPDADVASVGQKNFEWVVEHMSKWLVERVQQGAEPARAWHWREFLAGLDSRKGATPPRASDADRPKKLSPKAAISALEAKNVSPRARKPRSKK